jgi:catechol 2,3-dioxygenase-like lactoylglutathione lyase family enzyme
VKRLPKSVGIHSLPLLRNAVGQILSLLLGLAARVEARGTGRFPLAQIDLLIQRCADRASWSFTLVGGCTSGRTWVPSTVVFSKSDGSAPRRGGGVRVLRLAWLGIPTTEYAAMASFLRDTMGLRVEFEESTTIEFSLPSDDRVQLFGPGHPYFTFFEEHAGGAVALFEVDDLQQAAAELEAASVDIVGPPESDANWTWIHVRAPDGNLYELGTRRP